jgi:hypothetical protein
MTLHISQPPFTIFHFQEDAYTKHNNFVHNYNVTPPIFQMIKLEKKFSSYIQVNKTHITVSTQVLILYLLKWKLFFTCIQVMNGQTQYKKKLNFS